MSQFYINNILPSYSKFMLVNTPLPFYYEQNNQLEQLEHDFNLARTEIYQLSKKPANNILLELYALYKQATEGDCNIKPSLFDFKQKLKTEAWNSKKGMNKYNAMLNYINLVHRLINE